jgi:glutathione S-transferase
MLEECSSPYELAPVDIRNGDQRTSQFRDISPLMKIPAIEDGPVTMAESAAILMYLADKFPAFHLAPSSNEPKRGRFLQWLFFGAACLEPAMAEKMSGSSGNTISFGWGDFTRVTQALQDELARGPWILGDQFTAADIMLGDGARLAVQMKLWSRTPPISDYLDRIAERPAFQRAMAVDDAEAARLL